VQDKQGTVTLSFTACRDMLPDPAFYADCLKESFEELRAAALAAGKLATRGRRKSKARARPKRKVKR
jgi:hypothetical protein